MLVLCMLIIFLPQIWLEHPYCFRFTWIGPYQDKEHIGNLNCHDIHQDLNNVPCRKPLVATEHDSPPDTLALWNKYGSKPHLYGCPMTPGVSCAKFTYIYNKGVQNITYMCAKVNATDGCYRQRYLSGLEVSVCMCKSQIGHMPCNNAQSQGINVLKVVLFYLLNKYIIFFMIFNS